MLCNGSVLSALYVPPAQAAPAKLLDHSIRIVIDGSGAKRVSVMPPALPGPAAEALGDRVVLALEPSALGTRRAPPRAREACDPFLYGIGSALLSGFRVSRPPPRTYLDALAPAVSAHLRRYYPINGTRGSGSLLPERLARVVELIERRLADPLAVENIAQSIHMSPFHFARLFRRATGMSPHAFLTSRRLRRAKELLATTDSGIGEIARAVGYRTQAHFTHVFHEGVGMTPLRYRLRQAVHGPPPEPGS